MKEKIPQIISWKEALKILNDPDKDSAIGVMQRIGFITISEFENGVARKFYHVADKDEDLLAWKRIHRPNGFDQYDKDPYAIYAVCKSSVGTHRYTRFVIANSHWLAVKQLAKHMIRSIDEHIDECSPIEMTIRETAHDYGVYILGDEIITKAKVVIKGRKIESIADEHGSVITDIF